MKRDDLRDMAIAASERGGARAFIASRLGLARQETRAEIDRLILEDGIPTTLKPVFPDFNSNATQLPGSLVSATYLDPNAGRPARQYQYSVGFQHQLTKDMVLDASYIGTRGICSNYSFEHVAYTWETIRNFKGGTALFTVPNTAVKCGGAPQKIMYLADDAFRRNGVRDRSEVVFASPQKAIFAVEKYRRTLEQVIARKVALGLQSR